MSKKIGNKNGIVLVMFGTSVEEALPGLLSVRDLMVMRYPGTPVRMAFTSRIICRKWHERGLDQKYRTSNQAIPQDIYTIQGLENVVATMAKEGVRVIVSQQVYIAPSEEQLFYDFDIDMTLVSGRPAMGTYESTKYPYQDDITQVAKTLVPDITLARKEKAALFYMGHGNKSKAASTAYGEMVAEIRRQFPDIVTVMGLIDGSTSIDEIIAELKASNVEKILLKPFMLVAGDHARKDMVGEGKYSLQNQLEREGFTVLPVLNGLAENKAFADIFVQHTTDAARDAGVALE